MILAALTFVFLAVASCCAIQNLVEQEVNRELYRLSMTNLKNIRYLVREQLALATDPEERKSLEAELREVEEQITALGRKMR